ncbi:CoA transferase subunit A [Priestia flexa]|jgi:acetate CoA/acetoacetate CoA-transferase alpha subunit|uniref:CoA-transferase n=3 Tax=Priestia TaxID=2800373 RepID=A0A0V8JPP9_9BACI|nr:MULTISPECIES: CoA transferase subunit A [Bacillaceae]KSU89007.1 CoA-transferase [Priestia veravalensis]KZB91497.1 acyl CoA:acetate/3-ketoacid CoA transferase subunit alpha [Bacillus sp. VT 712]MBN8251691.1 CoA transferase subunit A [Priestia flexa]MBN8434892.1 CoA transferase subunit A [Priestia flexa]MBY6087445.1 CoA transferase subunit A [Priestia flexa]
MNNLQNRFHKMIKSTDVMSYVQNDMTIMFGGFGGVGTAPTVIEEILKSDVNGLTLICNDAGFPTIGVGKLVCEQRIKKLIASHIGSNPVAGKQMNDGILEVEFSPQGTLVERIRAAGVGIGGVLIDVGIETDVICVGKQMITLSGKTFLVETPLEADVSIVYAKKADEFGNLLYDKSARNTNPLVAMAGKVTIAEVEEIVPLGELNPDSIMTPGVFVNYIVQSKGVNWKWVWE